MWEKLQWPSPVQSGWIGARSGSCRPAAFAQMEDVYEAGEKLVMGLAADTTPAPGEEVAFGWLGLQLHCGADLCT